MSILPCPVRTVPSSPPGRITLLVRLSVLTPHARTRHDSYVRIERRSYDNDTDLFVKSVREYRRLHGDVEQIAAIDLLPNQ